MKLPTLPAFLKYDTDRKPLLLEARSSTGFIVSAVSIAVFTVGLPWLAKSRRCTDRIGLKSSQQDIFLYAVIVPVIPFALGSRVGIAQDHGMQNFLPCAETSIL